MFRILARFVSHSKNICIYSCTMYLPAMWNRMEIGSDWRSSDFRWVLLDSLNFRPQPVSPHRQRCMAMSYQFSLDNFSNTHETVFYMFRYIDLSLDRFSHCNTNRLYLCPNHFWSILIVIRIDPTHEPKNKRKKNGKH